MTRKCCLLTKAKKKKKLNLFEIELKSGKCKRKSRGLLQTLPVSFANLTGKNPIVMTHFWQFYHGKWSQEFKSAKKEMKKVYYTIY